jgi:nucleotide-binding universal stress UspA family protein
MKTLLISTDFSTVATHAAEYGYHLAKQIKADVILCNAVTVPAEVPQAGVVVWPAEEYDVLMEESKNEIKHLKHRLQSSDSEDNFEPSVTYINESGAVSEVVDTIIAGHQVDMVIMGTHGSSGFNHFFFGDHSRTMIDHTNKPLLLVPPSATISPVKKIAFATDLKRPEKDLEFIYDLIPLARQLDAEILLTHVFDEQFQPSESQDWIKQYLVDLSNKADYPHIFYRLIKNSRTENGLDWLCEHGHVDLLVMVHHQRSFFDGLFNGSHTKKMADHLRIPLLVFPDKPKYFS